MAAVLTPNPPEMVTILVKADGDSSQHQEHKEAQEGHAPSSDLVPPNSSSTSGSSRATVEIPHTWLTTALFEVLQVSGCSCPSHGPAVRGTYIECNENCGRPVYRRTDLYEEEQVLLYFWDERDGAAWCGWWFGNEVTSDSTIYGYNPGKTAPPPRTGWQCDTNSDADDTFVVDNASDEAVGKVRDSWFQAKLDRWQNTEEPPHITLEISQDCDASEGARLLKLRLESRIQAKAKATLSQDRWDPLRWWTATKGQVRALAAALHIFHMTLLEVFAHEVAYTLEKYGLPCPPSVVTIAFELEHAVVEDFCDPAAYAPIRFELPQVRKMVQDACRASLEYAEEGTEGGIGEECESLQLLAVRAMAGLSPTKEMVKIVVEAWFDCFVLHIPDRDLGLDPATDPPMPLLGSEKEGALTIWVLKVLAWIVHRRVEAYVEIVELVMARLPLKQEFVQIRRVDHDVPHRPPLVSSERVKLDIEFPVSVAELFYTCQNMLYVESALRPSLAEPISWVLRMAMKWLYPLTCYHSWTAEPQAYRCTPGVDGVIFAVASLQVQRAFMESLPVDHYRIFSNRAHYVHKEVRHILAPYAASLGPKDIRFLSTASFPAVEVLADETNDTSVQENGDGEPPSKRARC
mmetsp:Transcript_93894/g.205568  ORF Transcript_93894/g.205568 Transcript_93894/m.205568 type:complete len:632 (-) Transcript_93894:51-1946(-)